MIRSITFQTLAVLFTHTMHILNFLKLYFTLKFLGLVHSEKKDAVVYKIKTHRTLQPYQTILSVFRLETL
jgi:hypothetical protein